MLIDDDIHTWKSDVLQALFSDEDMYFVEGIHLSPALKEYYLVWNESSTEKFSVRSAYTLGIVFSIFYGLLALHLRCDLFGGEP